MALFHSDNEVVFNIPELRAIAQKVILSSSLIQRCIAGDLGAARALHLGYWPFVIGFQRAIDLKANANTLPRKPLYDRFTQSTTRRVLAATATTLRLLTESEFNGVFGKLVDEVRGMQQEELSHADYWLRDAANIGIGCTLLEGASVLPKVQELIDRAYADSIVLFFAHLAATEFIAEQLGEDLDEVRAPKFNRLFKGERERHGRWTWGMVHTLPHNDGPSHLEIDLDFARAYHGDGDVSEITAKITDSIAAFGSAADEVEKHYSRVGVLA